jgi:hypothetical protein
MKANLKESGHPFRDIVKKYAQLYRDSELARIDKSQYNAWLQAHADKISPSVKADIEKKVNVKLNKKDEASTSSAAGAYMTPFAFSRRGPGNVRAATQLGFKLAKPVKKGTGYALENQMYSEPAYITPAQNIEPVPTYKNKDGLVQHNDPEMDPNLVGFKQGQLPVSEGINGLKYEQEGQVVPQQPVQQPTKQKVVPQINLTSYDVQPDFTTFDQKLKNSTESLKINLQKTIQDKILGKKIVVRASKGFKQPEADYTINVTGVSIDYYYDRYVIIILGREENKQKMAKFFIKPGFKIKILGNADKLKPKDQYQVAKSKALVQDQPSTTPTNTVTGDEEQQTPPTQQPPAGVQPADQKTTA